jgi:hypothetical protein
VCKHTYTYIAIYNYIYNHRTVSKKKATGSELSVLLLLFLFLFLTLSLYYIHTHPLPGSAHRLSHVVPHGKGSYSGTTLGGPRGKIEHTIYTYNLFIFISVECIGIVTIVDFDCRISTLHFALSIFDFAKSIFDFAKSKSIFDFAQKNMGFLGISAKN